MDWLRENWFWLIVGILFLWMHLKLHGGHRHGTDRPQRHDGAPRPAPDDIDTNVGANTDDQH